MRLSRRKRRIIQAELNKPAEFSNLPSWLKAKEPLLMLSLVAARAKKGATLPAHFTKQQLAYYRKLSQKLGVYFHARFFVSPTTGKKIRVVDVAYNKVWFDKWEAHKIGHGTFYGYPVCCQGMYYAYARPRRKGVDWALKWVGLAPCTLQCKEANRIAKQYNSVISSLLTAQQHKTFKEFWSKY
ncbi:MAG: hypothetical protein IT324_33370 [Anaerolineae bacterium]|nr:hypothetical protein [Anaerolineae bacterium]